ncbi:MAG TPA: PspC domain-containing protein [Solirubrobacterales bacterium]|nr:PspC domain-containing protein [Solirubrobacterales bacterium]
MANQPKDSKSKKNQSEIGPRRPLLRSRDDRIVWGVAGGLAAHVGFEPILVRIAFVITSLFGGAGLLAYLVLAVALPEDDGTGKPVPESVWARLGKVALVSMLVLLALGLAAVLAAVSAWTAATGHGTVVAAIVIALGAALVAAAFIGESRRRLVPWLLAAALVFGIPAGAIAAADIQIDESMGERTYEPTTETDVPDSGYELGIGQLVVDLRELPWKGGRAIPVSAHLGLGQLIVSVPSNVCVDAHVTAKGGDLIVAGQFSDGIDPEVDQGEPLTDAPQLDLDADIQFGQVIVTDKPPEQVDSGGRGWERNPDRDDYESEADTQREVCGR